MMFYTPNNSITNDPLLQIYSPKLSNSETESSTGVSGCLSRQTFDSTGNIDIYEGQVRDNRNPHFSGAGDNILCTVRVRMRVRMYTYGYIISPHATVKTNPG